MSNPNIISVSAIRGKTIGFVVPTSGALLVGNQNNTNQAIKINSVIISNTSSYVVNASLLMYKNQISFSAPTNAGVISAVAGAAFTLTMPISSGTFLPSSTSLTGTTMGSGSNTISSVTTSGLNYIISVTNASGTIAGTQSSVTWTNPATFVSLETSLPVPGNSTIMLVTRDSGIYLEEGDYLMVSSSTSNSLNVTCGYEVIG